MHPHARIGPARLAAAGIALVSVLAFAAPCAAQSTTEPSAAIAPGPAAQPCPGLPVRVSAADANDALDACAGAADAIGFFRALGLEPCRDVAIAVRNELPPQAGASAAGVFLTDVHSVVVRTWAAFRQNRTWFDVPVDRAIYRGVVVHEVAHAIASCHFVPPRPTVQAREYVAYVALFSTLPPGLRERILKAAHGPGFERTEQITELFYAFDNARFGVEAYRHYAKPANGPAFLRDVLAGRALAD